MKAIKRMKNWKKMEFLRHNITRCFLEQQWAVRNYSWHCNTQLALIYVTSHWLRGISEVRTGPICNDLLHAFTNKPFTGNPGCISNCDLRNVDREKHVTDSQGENGQCVTAWTWTKIRGLCGILVPW
jgi:hypothetical protein